MSTPRWLECHYDGCSLVGNAAAGLELPMNELGEVVFVPDGAEVVEVDFDDVAQNGEQSLAAIFRGV